MALDELEIIVDVVDSFSDELTELQFDLSSVEGLAQAVDDINIDVDVHGDQELNRLMSQMAALQMMQLGAGVGVGGGGGDGGIADSADKAADSFDITNLRMSDLHNALAKLVPLIFVYIGALPAAIGGVLALGAAAVSAAAGLAAIGGLAAAGAFLQEDFTLQELIDRVKGDFEDAFGPLMDELVPLFFDALDGLEKFFDAVAARGDVLLALEDDVRAFGGFLLSWVPDVMEAMGQMAEAFGPLFGHIADALQEMSILRGLTEFMADAAPSFFAFVASLWSIIESLAQLSIGFMQVSSVVTQFLDRLVWLLSGFGMFEEQIGAAIGTLLTLATAFFLVEAATRLLNAEMAIFSGQSVAQAIAGSGGIIAAMKGVAGSVWATIFSIRALKVAIASTLVGLGLIALGHIVGWITSQFMNASSSIDEATKSLKQFDSFRSGMGDYGVGAGGTTFYEFRPDKRRTVINAPDVETGNRLANKVRHKENDSLAAGN